MKTDLKKIAKKLQHNSQVIIDYGGDDHPALLRKYAFKITDQIKKTIRGSVKNDPVARQYIPQIEELKILPSENPDPIGDEAHTPIKGLVHRYPDRVLLKLTSVCAVYCRFCFRREMVGPGKGVLKAQEIEAAIGYIKANQNIWEVIFTGGDPLMVAPRQLNEILDKIEAIDHVQVIRFHTRFPMVSPEKITPDLCAVLRRKKAVYVAVHVNHVNEITPEVESAIHGLQEAGCSLISQSVLLKGVNDDAAILETLFRKLVSLKVRPYYIHHPDLAPGTSHFRLSIQEGQKIMRTLFGRVSGLCQPHYMLDIPGGHGKVPIGNCFMRQIENGYEVQNYQGKSFIYRDE